MKQVILIILGFCTLAITALMCHNDDKQPVKKEPTFKDIANEHAMLKYKVSLLKYNSMDSSVHINYWKLDSLYNTFDSWHKYSKP